MDYIKTHLFYVIVIVGLVFAGRVWLQEHDARVLAEQTVKADESKVKDLMTSIQATQADADAKSAQIAVLVAKVKTPAQAINAIPSVAALPLNSRPAIDSPTQVSVDAVPLFTELAQCKSDAAQLAACKIESADKDQVIAQKNDEVKVLKKKPNFLHRLGHDLKTALMGAAFGEVLHVALKGAL